MIVSSDGVIREWWGWWYGGRSFCDAEYHVLGMGWNTHLKCIALSELDGSALHWVNWMEVHCIEWIGWKCIALRIGVWSRIQRRNWNTKTNRENCCFHTKCQSNADDGRVWETVHFPLHHRHWSEKSHKRSHSVMTIDTTTAVRTEFAKSIARTVLLFAGTILAGTTRRRYNTMHLPLTLHTKA